MSFIKVLLGVESDDLKPFFVDGFLKTGAKLKFRKNKNKNGPRKYKLFFEADIKNIQFAKHLPPGTADKYCEMVGYLFRDSFGSNGESIMACRKDIGSDLSEKVNLEIVCIQTLQTLRIIIYFEQPLMVRKRCILSFDQTPYPQDEHEFVPVNSLHAFTDPENINRQGFQIHPHYVDLAVQGDFKEDCLNHFSYGLLRSLLERRKPSALYKDFSLNLKELGFRENQEGFNCVRDRSGNIFPLRRPYGEEWKHELLSASRYFHTVKAELWSGYFNLLANNMMSIDDLGYEGFFPSNSESDQILKDIIAEDLKQPRPNVITEPPRLGECFLPEGAYVKPRGRYLIVLYERDGTTYYAVDSPFYGVGVNIFTAQSAAEKYVLRGEPRKEALNSESYLGPVVKHVGNYAARVDVRIDESRSLTIPA